MSANATYSETVISAQSALDTTHTAVAALAFTAIRILAKFGAGTSAGTIVLEGADTPSYAGVWALIATAAWATAANTTISASSTSVTAWPYVRARISVAVVGGTVDVVLAAN